MRFRKRKGGNRSVVIAKNRSKRVRKRKRVAIVGGGKTRKLAPYHDKSWEIWAFSSRDDAYPRVDRWFEIHAMTDLRQQLEPRKKGRRTFPDYMRYMQRLKCPVYMQKVHPKIPNSVVFPKNALVREFGRCFTSTASYLVALAIKEGYEEIGLWGINPKGSHYKRQRPALRYLLGVARQRGIRLRFPREFSIKIPAKPKFVGTRVLYAYDWQSPHAWWRERVWKRQRQLRLKGNGLFTGVTSTPHLTRSNYIRRQNRLIYMHGDRTGKTAVVVKRYQNASQAAQEARVMQAYGNAKNLVRLKRFFVRGAMGYIVMEQVKGRTLREVLKKHGSIRPRQVIRIALEILKGVESLHAAGYVHGDLHCGNIIVSQLNPPKVKIIDFQHAARKNARGIARARRTIALPPAKLAPETKKLSIDDRHDIYGVGFMCACMLKGRELKHRPHLLKTIGGSSQYASLWRIIRKATHSKPNRRYSSAREMIRALQAVK